MELVSEWEKSLAFKSYQIATAIEEYFKFLNYWGVVPTLGNMSMLSNNECIRQERALEKETLSLKKVINTLREMLEYMREDDIEKYKLM